MKSLLFPATLILFLFLAFTASADEIDCLQCHGQLTREKNVHPALSMGCESCHTAIDASVVPHRKTNNISKGLSAEQPDLCFGCHDKTLFSRKIVHPAISMGCTACHNPHSSKNAKLLLSEPPDLCFTCHDRGMFTKKTVHPPVAAGMCLSCHTPHSSDQFALLAKKPLDVCLECHPDVPRNPHVIAGFSAKRHPLGEPKKNKKGELIEPKDPAAPDKPFFCASCHNPHSTDTPLLFRFNAQTPMALCVNCHKM